MLLKVKVVFLEPELTFVTAVKLFKISVLDVGASVSHYHNQTENEGTLANGVSDGFDEIPAEPGDTEDGVVAHCELGSEECSQPIHSHQVTALLLGLNCIFLGVKLLELNL